MVDLIYIDDLLKWANKKQYNRNWQNRCGSCLAPCCYVWMSGRFYDYLEAPLNDDTEEEIFKKGDALWKTQKFWSQDFVIMKNIFSNESDKAYAEGERLQVCPLNVLGNCLIYEERPKMCSIWKCVMKIEEGNTLE